MAYILNVVPNHFWFIWLPDSACIIPHLCVSVPLVQEEAFNAYTLYMAHVHIHPLNMNMKYGACMRYMFYLVRKFLSSTYLAIKCKVKVALGPVLAYICRNLASICPFSMLECGSHMYSVIYVKYVKRAPCWMVGSSDIIFCNVA